MITRGAVHGLVLRAGTAVRRLGFRTQLGAFAVLLVAVAAGGSAAAGWQVAADLLERSTTERTDLATVTFASTYQQRVAEAELVARQVSERRVIAEAIRVRDPIAVLAVVEPILVLRPHYRFLVASEDGTVIARAPVTWRPVGERTYGMPGAAEAVEGDVTVATLVASGGAEQPCELAVVVTAPTHDTSGTTVGLVQVRFPMDDEFVRRVKYDTGLDSSLYCADRIVATTLPGGTGAPGARAPDAVREAVLLRGQTHEAPVSLPGPRDFRMRWMPLLDLNERAVGMYAVGTPVQSLREARARILAAYVPVTGGIAIGALVLASVGSFVLTVPLRRLAHDAARIGAGDLDHPVAVAPSRDEVGQLAARMEEMRRGIASTWHQLRELNALKDEYLFSVAHEVRTPLASLVALAELLAEDADRILAVERPAGAVVIPSRSETEQLRLLVYRVSRSVTRLNVLVENVLDAGSIRAGRFGVHMGRVDLEEVIDLAILTVTPLLQGKGQEVAVARPESGSEPNERAWEMPTCWGDSRRLVQVMVNVLSNASKYGPDGDRIVIDVVPCVAPETHDPHARPTSGGQRAAARASRDVGVASPPASVRVSVRDNGPGIPLPDQADVFERHFRASTAVLTAPGTGLGLAITRAIVEAHGGSVGLTSEPGNGTTVWFTVPVAE